MTFHHQAPGRIRSEFDDEIRLLLSQFRDVVFKRELLYPQVEIIVVPGASVEKSGGSAEGIYPPNLFLGCHQVTAILVELSTATP